MVPSLVQGSSYVLARLTCLRNVQGETVCEAVTKQKIIIYI